MRPKLERTSRSGTPTNRYGRGRLRIDAKWRIGAASATVGLIMCGALAISEHSHKKSVRADADAAQALDQKLAAEHAVSAFWQEREAMSEALAFPERLFGGEVRLMRLRFGQAVGQIGVQTPAELLLIERAMAANARLVAIFNYQSPDWGRPRARRGADRLHIAEQSVLAPIAELTATNQERYLRARAASASADQARDRSMLVGSLLGLAAVTLFAAFAVRLVRRLDKQNVALQLADAAKDELISTVSHELRTPLTSLHGYAELLLDAAGDPLTEEQRSFLATMRRGSIRLERLVDDLLLNAQIHSGRLEVRKTSADLAEIVRHSIEDAQTEADRNRIQLSLAGASRRVLIAGDGVRLAQAVDNVISNAIKFTPEGGRIDVSLAQAPGRVTITVADTGMGMTAADIEHLFERFFRAESAHSNLIQGVGLGLPIVKAIVDAHDGKVSVTSEPNHGTSFVISLPVERSNPAARQEPQLVA